MVPGEKIASGKPPAPRFKMGRYAAPTVRRSSSGPQGAVLERTPAKPVAPAPAPVSRVEPNAEIANGPSRIGFFFLVCFVFTSASRVFDLALDWLHLPLILSILAAVFTVVGGALGSSLQTRAAKLLSLFSVWIVVCVPFSVWKGASFALLKDEYFKSFLVFLMVAGSVTTFARIRTLMTAVACGTVLATIVALSFNARLEGRLVMKSGYLSNPNDFAQILLVGMCFLPVISASRSRMATWFVWLSTPLLMIALYLTGSRAVLLTLLAVGVIVFFYASPGRKLVLLCAVVLCVAGFFSVASTSRNRLTALFTNAQPYEQDNEANASTQNRTRALKSSLILTIRNPIFGVGPGVFDTAAADLSHESGQRALWLQSHNSYTQVSSETGFPGILLFGGAVLASIVDLLRIRHSRKPHPSSVSRVINCVLLGFVSFAVTCLFSSVAYQFYFCMMLGLCAATIVAAGRAAVPVRPSLSTVSRAPVR